MPPLKRANSKSKEILIAPAGAIVTKIRVMFFKNYSEQADGTFAGV
jgi:hypothetical protein